MDKKPPTKNEKRAVVGVEDYDFVRMSRGDQMNVPSSRAGDECYTRPMKFWRCFSPLCKERVDTLLDGMSAEDIH